MVKKKVLTIYIISGLLLIGCVKKQQGLKFPQEFFFEDSTKNVLLNTSYFVSSFPEDWNFKFIGSFEANDTTTAEFSKLENDTLKYVVVALDKNNNAISILQYEKEFPDGVKKYHVVFGRSDTLYCFYTLGAGKVFVNGEYFYKGSHLGFESDERKYYQLYKDSLNRVKGNNLPKLPPLSKAEEEKYTKLF